MKFFQKNKVVYIPLPVKGNKTNAYTSNMVKILHDRYKVVGILAELNDIIQMLQTKAVFLNWVEKSIDKKMKTQLILYRLLGAKIIWVFHNKYPHDEEETPTLTQNIRWLAKYSNIILLHSKGSRKYIPDFNKNKKKAVYLPHVLYHSQNDNVDPSAVRIKYGISEKEFLFTIFGAIKPYKNIESAIEAFQNLNLPNAKLLIAGNPINIKYAKKIEYLCQASQNIVLDLQYIPNVMLDNIIDISDVIVLPYKDGSSMNSGVMIQAFSKGRTIIAPDICMAKDMMAQKFFYLYKKSLKSVMKKAYHNGKEMNAEMGRRAKAYIQENNNDELVKQKLYKILQ